MTPFTIEKNNYLTKNIQAFYHTDYIGYGKQGNPDYLNTFKNTFNSYSNETIQLAKKQLLIHLEKDIFDIAYKHQELNIGWPLTISIIPRAKSQNSYHVNQLQFYNIIKNCVTDAIKDLEQTQYHTILADGCDYIIRHTDTRTTHLDKSGYGGMGLLPYPGISKDTCHFSKEISGKDILLIDDIYTKTVNIDEDMIQALLDNGAKNVIFYSIGKTV